MFICPSALSSLHDIITMISCTKHHDISRFGSVFISRPRFFSYDRFFQSWQWHQFDILFDFYHPLHSGAVLFRPVKMSRHLSDEISPKAVRWRHQLTSLLKFSIRDEKHNILLTLTIIWPNICRVVDAVNNRKKRLDIVLPRAIGKPHWKRCLRCNIEVLVHSLNRNQLRYSRDEFIQIFLKKWQIPKIYFGEKSRLFYRVECMISTQKFIMECSKKILVQ